MAKQTWSAIGRRKRATAQVTLTSGTGNITINGVDAYDKYNGWEFPKIKPGKNEIKITNASAMLINIEYQPRYI